MKATFENTMERGRGYARLRLSEVTDASSGGWRFSLCRASDMTYLGRSGWQNSEDFTEPEAYTTEGDNLILHIGPDVVDKLDPNENYRIALQSDTQSSQKATFAITTLNRTLMDAQGHVASGTAKKTAAAPPPPQAVPDAEPAPVDTAPPLPPPVPEAPAKSRSPLVLAALLLLLLAGGGGAYWYMTQAKAPPPVEMDAGNKAEEALKAEEARKAEEASKAEEARIAEEKRKAEEALKAEEAKTPPPSARVQASEYLSRRDATPQGARDLAHQLPKSSAEEQDAAYRLWLFADMKGDLSASLELARAVDPTLPAWGTIAKNGAEAWRLYAKAAPQHPDAANALRNLKEWMETEAQRGNKEATGWIRTLAEDAAKQKR
jgi:hypothetical protein